MTRPGRTKAGVSAFIEGLNAKIAKLETENQQLQERLVTLSPADPQQPDYKGMWEEIKPLLKGKLNRHLAFLWKRVQDIESQHTPKEER